MLHLTRSLLRTAARPIRWRQSYSIATKASEPLRILFCGSDKFSCESLQALHDEHKRDTDLIRSIDVVVRPSKPTGRGNKVMSEVPIRTLAERLNLPVHVRDTFTGWAMPKPHGDPINLIIAVSFGLFVPPRLINASKYGGLNVHPSLLPDLRGPAPIHHALLAERTHTGISIQTLSPRAFDEGTILLQTPSPGIPIPPQCTPQQLHDLLAPEGARMLVEALRRRLHVPPYRPVRENDYDDNDDDEGRRLRHAPKITTADRQIRWTASGAGRVALQARVLGPLWSHLAIEEGVGKRVILEDVEEAVVGRSGEGEGRGGGARHVTWLQKSDGAGKAGVDPALGKAEVVTLRYVVGGSGTGKSILVQMVDGSWLRVGRIKVEGSISKPARGVLESMRPR
ncbi:methionyl-tRNA formyltransferase-like protein [Chaetomium strumarium]|uniref:methionyl-tRNA formyltransferase n=1 Tax=Chaetomium strumarium TaxID=1170767 RepID=A0AAJ0GXK3_9PEZI|nr:methionyl-tRNA formyltransferase-like protein [Chaetomium strumarium]